METITQQVRQPCPEQLEYYAAATPSCVLRPYRFFVSWQGVLTLVYRGLPPALAKLKQDINEYHEGLPAENPGSKWPKTSLGAVKDGKRLNPQQLETLLHICREESGRFQKPQSPKLQAVLVDKLKVVLYQNRSLERRIVSHVLPLQSTLDLSEVTQEEKKIVDDVVNEADNPDYWFQASRDGSREAHYRDNVLGVTLIHDLAVCQGSAMAEGYGSQLPGILESFRQRVDRELPGLYAWFSDASLHVTVRALIL